MYKESSSPFSTSPRPPYKKEYMICPTTVYNDNSLSIQWASNMTTKGLRHVHIQENAVCESVLSGFLQVKHVQVKVHLSGLFIKED